ncbi:MAG: hypothetical protein VKJ09_14650 [Leptolyngbya sp.]|nr:hypothetical protein [Leptolyngbya sp.]
MTAVATFPQASTPASPKFDRKAKGDVVKSIGVAYCQILVKVGVPKPEAVKIAAAIAKFDIVNRQPSPEQRELIAQFSALICRAQLWRSHLLLS